MHDIWNPWHGCSRVSEGCRHCYMYFLDERRNRFGGDVYRTQLFNYPLLRDRSGCYKVRSGELIRVCMTSDFFLPEADKWRGEAWNIIRQRPDVRFFLLTKRPERVQAALPPDWGDGWENVWFNVSCENQQMADQRVPLLLQLPFKHKGIMAAPLIGELDLECYLAAGAIEQVVAGGENYGGSRPCDFDWVKSLSEQCKRHDVRFCFIETGTKFIKDGRLYSLPDKRIQTEMALKAGVNNEGRPIVFKLHDPLGFDIADDQLYKPYYRQSCLKCGSRMICNGCSNCGKCKPEITQNK
ncbi:MAG: phage Gp37/Gp68 family protein [Muribaculaceae bacterium]|nr:phage Gp37/Gp68 family protein [Muribaculaceae bacterium]